MSTSSTAPIAPVRKLPTSGEVAGAMVRYTVWFIIASTLLEAVAAVWRGDHR